MGALGNELLQGEGAWEAAAAAARRRYLQSARAEGFSGGRRRGPCGRRASLCSSSFLYTGAWCPPWKRIRPPPGSPGAASPALRSDEGVGAPCGPHPPASSRPWEGGGSVRPAVVPAQRRPAPWGRYRGAPVAHAAPAPFRARLPPLKPGTRSQCPPARSSARAHRPAALSRPPPNPQDVAQRRVDPVGVRGHAADRPAPDGVRLVFCMASFLIEIQVSAGTGGRHRLPGGRS